MSIELTERKTPKDRLLDRTGEAFAQDDQLHRLPQRRIRPPNGIGCKWRERPFHCGYLTPW